MGDRTMCWFEYDQDARLPSAMANALPRQAEQDDLNALNPELRVDRPLLLGFHEGEAAAKQRNRSGRRDTWFGQEEGGARSRGGSAPERGLSPSQQAGLGAWPEQAALAGLEGEALADALPNAVPGADPLLLSPEMREDARAVGESRSREPEVDESGHRSQHDALNDMMDLTTGAIDVLTFPEVEIWEANDAVAGLMSPLTESMGVYHRSNPVVKKFIKYLDGIEEIRRRPDEDFIFYKIADSPDELPEEVLHLLSSGGWQGFTQRKGDLENGIRINDHYHLYIFGPESKHPGVYVHYDYYSPNVEGVSARPLVYNVFHFVEARSNENVFYQGQTRMWRDYNS